MNFLDNASATLNWIQNYWENITDYPVTPRIEPGQIFSQLPVSPPEAAEEYAVIFSDFQNIILPGMTHWQHPAFFGYFPANISEPSFLAEMLMAALGAQCMSWLTSPAATELEERVMQWLQQMLGLPSDFVGVIQDTASTATLCAIITAREVKSQFQINQRGFTGQEKFTLYASEQAHSSIEKAVRVAGLGSDYLRKIPVDQGYALRPEALAEAIETDLLAGYQPLCVIAAFGTTGTTAIDPLGPIAELCHKYQIWLHVDAAFAGAALILPELRGLAQGIERADSIVFNPHKWLMTHFDCSAYFVRDPQVLTRTFGLTPEYLKTSQDQEVNNYRDWGIQLGRRFRALKLWFVIRSYGVTGLQNKLRQDIRWAQELKAQIQATPNFEILAPVPLNTLCFRYAPAEFTEDQRNTLNQTLLQILNANGRLFITHTELAGKYTLRMVIGQTQVTWDHVTKAWEEIQATAKALILK